ncbi:MAG TPA: DUF192 domain-containing protein [Candidatus Nanoarchaeia archaeon]|nr:DUF192 domain-containing protein [Candidatus Nanoarchaeia archaeon]
MNIEKDGKKYKIAIDKVCTSTWSQVHGLMFSKPKTLLFPFKSPRRILIHNWFVFFPIDLFFLDKSRNVIEIKRRLLPFSWYKCQKPANFLIEVPSKSSHAKAIVVHDSKG